MIRKTTVSLILIVVVSLAVLVGLVAPTASRIAGAFHGESAFLVSGPVPTPTPSGSGVSGGGNGGG